MKVTAPASTANLGPGFDCLGAAVSLALEVTDGASGSGAELIERAVRLVAPDADVSIEVSRGLPQGRGLGSSAACIAAGLVLGCGLTGKRADPAELLRLGLPLEGHPDNLAPALYGGICLALPDGDVMRFEPAASVRPVILLPREQLSTAKARKALPEQVPHADAVANIGRSSGLLAMLTGAIAATPERLLECTEDLLHQPYRAPLMKGSDDAIKRLREAGVAAALSGAGPSVVCLVLRGEEQDVRDNAGDMDVLELDWDLEGARITES